jgi:hypothetical protein
MTASTGNNPSREAIEGLTWGVVGDWLGMAPLVPMIQGTPSPGMRQRSERLGALRGSQIGRTTNPPFHPLAIAPRASGGDPRSGLRGRGLGWKEGRLEWMLS